jgi:putative tryptophan/tyrosine transport system substrate-binding protein
MKRRTFIAGLGSAAAWPVVARAQQPAMPVVGYLETGTPEGSGSTVTAFRKGLSETSFVEGKNVTIEYRFGNNDPARVPELVADLIRRRVAVIASVGPRAATLAVKAATTTIPIVFRNAGDPVQDGIVASFNRPGGNITGITSMSEELGPKRLGLLHELMPKAERLGVLTSTTFAVAPVTSDLRAAAAAIGRQLEVFAPTTNRDIDAAFENMVEKRVDAFLVSPIILLYNRRVQIITLAAHHRIPAIYFTRDFVEVGGLMSYGSDPTYQFGETGVYVGRILKGEKPADLPVLQPTKFEFVLNLQTARTLGVEVPPTLLGRADEVIE